MYYTMYLEIILLFRILKYCIEKFNNYVLNFIKSLEEKLVRKYINPSNSTKHDYPTTEFR